MCSDPYQTDHVCDQAIDLLKCIKAIITGPRISSDEILKNEKELTRYYAEICRYKNHSAKHGSALKNLVQWPYINIPKMTPVKWETSRERATILRDYHRLIVWANFIVNPSGYSYAIDLRIKEIKEDCIGHYTEETVGCASCGTLFCPIDRKTPLKPCEKCKGVLYCSIPCKRIDKIRHREQDKCSG